MTRLRAIVLCLLLAAPGPLARGADRAPLRADVSARLVVVRAIGGPAEAAFAWAQVGPGEDRPLFRLSVRGGKLLVEPAGRLPADTGAVCLVPSPSGEGGDLLLGRPGRIDLLPVRFRGEAEPGPPRALVEDPHLAPRGFLPADLDGNGTRELLVETWAGALVLRREDDGWRTAGWLPLPRYGWLVGGGLHLRAGALLEAPPGLAARRTWAEDVPDGIVRVFRGAPASEPAAEPPAGLPPLATRVRFPRRYAWEGASLLVPGEPDRAILLRGAPAGKLLGGTPDLLVVRLDPGDGETITTPELVVSLPLDALEDSPLLDLVDADGDGTRDIVVTARARGGRGRSVAVEVLRGLGGGRFAGEPLAWQGRVGRSASALAMSDLDGDGRLDVLASAQDTLAWWRGREGRPGSLPWGRKPTATWKLPWRDGRAPVAGATLVDGERRWQVVPVYRSGRNATAILALPLP